MLSGAVRIAHSDPRCGVDPCHCPGLHGHYSFAKSSPLTVSCERAPYVVVGLRSRGNRTCVAGHAPWSSAPAWMRVTVVIMPAMSPRPGIRQREGCFDRERAALCTTCSQFSIAAQGRAGCVYLAQDLPDAAGVGSYHVLSSFASEGLVEFGHIRVHVVDAENRK